MPVRAIGRSRAIEVQRAPLNRMQRAAKRFIDLALAIPILALLSPFFAATALAIRLESKGPVLLPAGTAGSAAGGPSRSGSSAR